jgi:hypothetical protein
MHLKEKNFSQIHLAELLGIDVSADTENIAAARLEDAVAAAIYPNEQPRHATEAQVAFARSLGLDTEDESLRVASAKIDEELFRRNPSALESLELKPGDRVLKRETFSYEGQTHVLEREYIVSSIDESSLRVWFRGGNGQGAWPSQLLKVPGTSGCSAASHLS